MFSETRYAMNGDLRVAYRASRPSVRDIAFVPNWLSNCEVASELPSVQGWVEDDIARSAQSFSTSRAPELSCGFKGYRRSNWLDHLADQLVGIQEGDDL